jgi:hypothetical protein
MEDFDDFAVDAAGHYIHFAPPFFLFLRCALYHEEFSLLLPILCEAFQGEIGGNLVGVVAGGIYPKLLRDGHKLHFVLYLIALSLSLCRHIEVVGDISAMVGVSRSANRGRSRDISRDDAICINAAGAQLGSLAERIYTAGAHIALLTAHSQFSEPAVGFL